jgi:solute carrier family 45 protein 1/2/4
MGQIMAYELDREPDGDLATRTGELAMLIYSVGQCPYLTSISVRAHPVPSVGVVAGTILPHLANRDRRLLGYKSDVDEDAEMSRLRDMVRQWRIDAARAGKPLKLPVMPFLLRNIWTGALLLFSFLTLTTFFISTVVQATIFISLVGICWAVAMWVPFAIIMEVCVFPSSPAIGC